MKTLKPNRRKSRGLEELRLRIGDITGEIDARLERKERISILELGCGYGVALLELCHRYGARLQLHGINKKAEDGNYDTMKKIAVERRLFSKNEIHSIALPELHYFDACAPWPLPSNHYDIIFSQHSFLWFEDKIKPLEEINRVMKSDGVALLDLRVTRAGCVDKSSIVIHDSGRKISFRSYLRQFDNLKINQSTFIYFQRFWRWLNRKIGHKIKSTARRCCFEMRKRKRLNFNLEFLSANQFPINSLGRKGVQSIYRRKEH